MLEGASGISKITTHHILTEYLMKKKVLVRWAPNMLFPAQKNSHGTVLETFDSLRKGRNCVFATNNLCRWNLSAWLWTQIQSEVRKGKNSQSPQKFQCQNLKVKQMITMTYDYTSIIATYVMTSDRAFKYTYRRCHKTLMCQIMHFSLYCIKGPIEGRRIN